jgi:hypothetical protein
MKKENKINVKNIKNMTYLKLDKLNLFLNIESQRGHEVFRRTGFSLYPLQVFKFVTQANFGETSRSCTFHHFYFFLIIQIYTHYQNTFFSLDVFNVYLIFFIVHLNLMLYFLENNIYLN